MVRRGGRHVGAAHGVTETGGCTAATGFGKLGTHSVGFSAAASDAALDHYLKGQLDEQRLPGLSAAVVRDGRIEHLVAFGEADDKGRAMTPQTPVLLASLSTGFTALTVM